MGVLLALGGILLASVAIARRPRWIFAGVVGCTWLVLITVSIEVYTPQFNQRYPIKAFSEAVRARVDPAGSLYVCGPVNDLALSFNMGRYLPALSHDPDVVRYLSSQPPVYCVMDLPGYRRVRELTDRQLSVLLRQAIDDTAVLLISSQP